LRAPIIIRSGTWSDVSAVEKAIARWQSWEVQREKSIRRAIRNKELLVADREGELVGFIHYAMHEDVIDGGLNAFITTFYVAPEFRDKGVGSKLLRTAIKDALKRGAVGIETSTANPDAKRLYERHFFRQFMGRWTMGEVFLELEMNKYRNKRKENLQNRDAEKHANKRT
jgi:ribosomal protein S18 acetylase RimI-like enzyme